jgi:hypothetical protein
LTPVSYFRGRAALSVENVPAFLTVTGPTPGEVEVPGDPASLTVAANAGAPQGPVTLTVRASSGNAFSATATIVVNVGSVPPPPLTFGAPSQIAKDTNGRIYVADTQNHRIVQLTSGGALLTVFGTQGSGAGQFDGPHGVALDIFGRIYIADTGNDRVVRIDDISGAGWATMGSNGSGSLEFLSPSGIDILHGELGLSILVADQGNNRIVSFQDMSGTGWATYGSEGGGVGQFSLPFGIVGRELDSTIFVADSGNHRIVQIANMSGSGWTAYGQMGSGIGEFTFPRHLSLDPTGRLHVADQGNHRLVRVSLPGGADWTSLGSQGNGVGQFSYPLGQLPTDAGEIFASDTGNNRVVFMKDFSGAGWRTAP